MENEFDYILVDGMNLCRIMDWVFKSFVDKRGRKSGLFYGVLNFIFKCFSKYGTNIFFLWDSPRLKKKIENENYKSGRTKAGDDFYERLSELKKIIELLGVTQCFSFGYEADDIASKIVKENSSKKILLVSNDSDWRLFSNKNVSFLIKNEIKKYDDFYGEGKEFLNPKQELFFQAVTGSHNGVKGIPRINKKNVREIIVKSESIDDVFSGGIGKERIIILQNRGMILNNIEMIKGIDRGYKVEYNFGKKDFKLFLTECKKYSLTSIIQKAIESGL